MIFFKLIIISIVLASCSSNPYKKEMHNSISELNYISRICGNKMDNKLLAKKECYPLLKHRSFYIELSKVDELSHSDISAEKRVVLLGKSGSKHTLACHLNSKQSKEIMDKPDLLTIGKVYVIKSKKASGFIKTTFNKSNDAAYSYALEECSYMIPQHSHGA